MTDAFGTYAVEVAAAGAAERLASQLFTYGIATFDGIPDRHSSTLLAQQILQIWHHRDSEPDGVTVLVDRGDLSRTPGMAGFGHQGLDLHTEASTTASPPQLMMLVCSSVAAQGGTCQVADGYLAYKRLSTEWPELFEQVSTERSVLFGGASGHLGAVFESSHDGRVSVRLRTDSLVKFSPQLADRLSELRQVVQSCAVNLNLQPGQGYLLCNTRWLHGREAFQGERLMYRILGNPLPSLQIPAGFEPVPAPRQHIHA